MFNSIIAFKTDECDEHFVEVDLPENDLCKFLISAWHKALENLSQFPEREIKNFTDNLPPEFNQEDLLNIQYSFVDQEGYQQKLSVLSTNLFSEKVLLPME